jgi:hypothetical protein
MKDHIEFEDVLHELMLEEAAPDYATLRKWQERYPEWHDSLAEYFAAWAIQSEPIDDEPEIDEEAIAQKIMARAMNMLREQGRLIPRDHVEPVQPFDQAVLAAIYVLRGEGDASDIADKITDMQGSEASLGATLMSLSRLEEKGLIETWKSGEKNRKHFNITIAGERALAYAQETSRVVTGLLGDLA